MNLVHELDRQIRAGRIIFDPPAPVSARLRDELLGQASGTKVTPLLQALVLEVARLATIRISSIVRTSGHHGSGRAFDIGNEEIAGALLPLVATNARVRALGIDEIIFDAAAAGEQDRNKWNYDQGSKHSFDEATLQAHRNHIHFAVAAAPAIRRKTRAAKARKKARRPARRRAARRLSGKP